MAVITTATEALAHGAYWGPGTWWPIFPLFWVLLLGLVIFTVFRFRRDGWHRHQSAEDVWLSATRAERSAWRSTASAWACCGTHDRESAAAVTRNSHMDPPGQHVQTEQYQL